MIHDVNGYVVCWTSGNAAEPEGGRALSEACFAQLPLEMQADIIAMIAEVSEKGYRCGVRQGIVLSEKNAIAHDLVAWRFNTPFGVSKWVDSNLK